MFKYAEGVLFVKVRISVDYASMTLLPVVYFPRKYTPGWTFCFAEGTGAGLIAAHLRRWNFNSVMLALIVGDALRKGLFVLWNSGVSVPYQHQRTQTVQQSIVFCKPCMCLLCFATCRASTCLRLLVVAYVEAPIARFVVMLESSVWVLTDLQAREVGRETARPCVVAFMFWYAQRTDWLYYCTTVLLCHFLALVMVASRLCPRLFSLQSPTPQAPPPYSLMQFAGV